MKHCMNFLTMFALFVAASVPCAPATAESFRCGNDPANTGDSPASIHTEFGAPVFKESFCKLTETVSIQNATPNSTVVNVMTC